MAKRVILVEDDEHIGPYVAKYLETTGFEVQHFPDGNEVVEHANAFRPSVAILDVMLPGISGFEICRKFRTSPELYLTSILVLTSMGEEEERDHAIGQGADDFLSKPFRIPALFEKVTALERLYQVTRGRDPITGLHTASAFRKAVAHAVTRGAGYSVCCVEVQGLATYQQKHGGGARDRVLQDVAGIVREAAEKAGVRGPFVSHLGGGFFGLLLPPDTAEAECASMTHHFNELRSKYHTPEELETGLILLNDARGLSHTAPVLGAVARIQPTRRGESANPAQVFEQLEAIMRGVQPTSAQSVLVDRRSRLASKKPEPGEHRTVSRVD